MKSIRTEVEGILLSGAQDPRGSENHPACFDTEVLEERLRVLISGDSVELHRYVLADVCTMAFRAYSYRDMSPSEIAANPATVPLVSLMLLILDRYRDNVSVLEKMTCTKLRKALAEAFFLVRPRPGVPGLFTVQQEMQFIGAYQAMKKQAEARRKTRGTAHEQGVQAAYQNVCSGIETQEQRKKKIARIKLVLKMRGIPHRSASG